MKITKYEHACIVVEENGQSLVIDPGGYTTDFVVPDNTVVVVITHEHNDHLDKEKLRAIADKNPNVCVLAHADVTSQLEDFDTKSVVANEGIKIGNFEVQFFGGEHAPIYPDGSTIPNLGVMVNDRLYYPGDSFTVPDQPVEILALPVAAPWLKISETMEFLQAVKPKIAFPTHDAILSDSGKALPDTMLPAMAQKVGASYQRLREPLEI